MRALWKRWPGKLAVGRAALTSPLASLRHTWAVVFCSQVKVIGHIRIVHVACEGESFRSYGGPLPPPEFDIALPCPCRTRAGSTSMSRFASRPRLPVLLPPPGAAPLLLLLALLPHLGIVSLRPPLLHVGTPQYPAGEMAAAPWLPRISPPPQAKVAGGMGEWKAAIYGSNGVTGALPTAGCDSGRG